MRLTKLTTILSASAFILVVGLILNVSQLYWMAGVLLTLPFVGWAYAALQARGINATRKVPRSGRVGDWVSFEIEASNPTPLPKLNLWVEDNLPEGLTLESATHLPVHLPSYEAERVTYNVRLERRGLHKLTSARFVSADPLGLSAVSTEVPCESELLVYPRLVALKSNYIPLGAEGALAENATSNRRGESFIFDGIREYKPGDPLRRVHWRSSARWGRLAVVEFEDERAGEMLVALETRKGSSAGKGAETSFEYAVTLAASLVSAAAQQGRSVRLITSDQPAVRQSARVGAVAVSEIMDRLATIEADAEQSLDARLPLVLESGGQGSSLIWITSIGGSALVEAASSISTTYPGLCIIGLENRSFTGSKTPDAEWQSASEQLVRLGVPFCLVRKGDPLARVMATFQR